MNTVEELTGKYGFPIKTAQMMIDSYKKRIGNKSGVLKIDDINYIGDGDREIKLVCTLCGEVYTPIMKSGNYKWSDLPKTCGCDAEMELNRQRNKARLEERDKAKEQERIRQLESEIGKVYGDFTVIGYKHRKEKQDSLIGRCNMCGAEKPLSLFKNKNTHCTKHYEQTTKFDESYIGRKNNRLTITGITKGKDGRKMFVCECECGNTTNVKPTFWEDGRVKSCGCYQENRSVDANEITRIKGIYRGMKSRCYDPKNKSYRRYGGRGIIICDEWLNDMNSFINWSLNNGYNNKLTIDRIDNDGIYSPDNCRWATYKVQNQNRSVRGKQSEYANN